MTIVKQIIRTFIKGKVSLSTEQLSIIYGCNLLSNSKLVNLGRLYYTTVSLTIIPNLEENIRRIRSKLINRFYGFVETNLLIYCYFTNNLSIVR